MEGSGKGSLLVRLNPVHCKARCGGNMVETSVGHKLPLLLAVSVHRINGSFQCGQLFDGIALGFPQKLHGFLTDIADFH